ncbi:TPA: phage holin, lambda family, partial [Klebsiella pneumoniae]|nr:phage holin, lambda family [Klebsiella pneumoniae]
EKKTQEMLLCGVLTLAFSSALEYLGLPKTLSVALGGATGLTGVDTIRSLVMSYLGKRFGTGNEKDKV